jgi:CHAD domain-containing protein
MKLEARFAIPDPQTFEKLRTSHALDQCSLGPAELEEIEDIYLDTEDRRIARAGFACHIRWSSDHCVVSLKKRERPQAPLHRYEVLSTELPSPLPLPEWPPSPLRAELTALVGSAALNEVLALGRTRERREVVCQTRRIAELCLDRTRQALNGATEDFLDLAIRLRDEGTEDDLRMLVDQVEQAFDVLPQPISRYQRGIAVAGTSPISPPIVTHEEYHQLREITTARRRYASRARALIALHHGATQEEAGTYAGLTGRRVRHWLAEFRENRMGIFPASMREGHIESQHSSGSPSPPDADKGPSEPAASPVVQGDPDAVPGVAAEDTMAEAARKIFLRQFLEMQRRESQTRIGTDPEELHKMRVATRRMRAAVPVFKRYLRRKCLKPFVGDIRATAKILGQVRDLDVAREKTAAYLDSDAGTGADLTPLLRSWDGAHRTARDALEAYLESEAYFAFKRDFGAFLSGPLPPREAAPDRGEAVPEQVRYVAPFVIHRHIGELRAYDAWVADGPASLEIYHQLRIVGKRLRYTLEFFGDCLGPEVGTAIDMLKRLQDHVGDLQDAVVASNRLRNFWIWGTWDPPSEKEYLPVRPQTIIAPDVARYHAEKQGEIQRLTESFQDVWQPFSTTEFSRLIAAAVSIL